MTNILLDICRLGNTGLANVGGKGTAGVRVITVSSSMATSSANDARDGGPPDDALDTCLVAHGAPGEDVMNVNIDACDVDHSVLWLIAVWEMVVVVVDGVEQVEQADAQQSAKVAGGLENQDEIGENAFLDLTDRQNDEFVYIY